MNIICDACEFDPICNGTETHSKEQISRNFEEYKRTNTDFNEIFELHLQSMRKRFESVIDSKRNGEPWSGPNDFMV